MGNEIFWLIYDIVGWLNYKKDMYEIYISIFGCNLLPAHLTDSNK